MKALFIIFLICFCPFINGDSDMKRLLVTVDNSAAYVQTTSPTVFKREFAKTGQNFDEWQNRAFNFFLHTYGLDFSSAPSLGIDAYGAPDKMIPGALLYLLTFNLGYIPSNDSLIPNIQGQKLSMAEGFPEAKYLTSGNKGDNFYGKTYNWHVLFNATYWSNPNNTISGKIGRETNGKFSNQFVTTFYGYQEFVFNDSRDSGYSQDRRDGRNDRDSYSSDSNERVLFKKKFVHCAPQPSVANHQIGSCQSSDPQELARCTIRITNRITYIDLDTSNKRWPVGSGSVDEYQFPGFVLDPATPIHFVSENNIRFPSLYPHSVSNITCLE